MYYVPDDTTKCGYYKCKKCGDKFLDLKTEKVIICPSCEMEIDSEIGPDEEMPVNEPTAELIKVVEGEEVEKMDQLLSLAITGGDFNWI